MNVRPLSFGVLGLFAVLALSACQRSAPPLEQKITAGTPGGYMMWRGGLIETLTKQQREDFDDAVKELRLAVMVDGSATGSEAIDAAWRAKIDGLTIREAMRQGYETRLQRLETEHEELGHFIDRNSRLRTNPGDTASADYLARKRDEQNERLEALAKNIAATQAKLAALGPGPTTPEAPAEAPAVEQPVRVRATPSASQKK
jgi:hypothetical protein